MPTLEKSKLKTTSKPAAKSEGAKRPTAAERRQAQEQAENERISALRERRLQAVQTLRLVVDTVEGTRDLLREAMTCNIMMAGLKEEEVNLSVKVYYSEYNPSGGHLPGTLGVKVSTDWPRLEHRGGFSMRKLTDGLGAASYSLGPNEYANLGLLKADTEVSFGIDLEADEKTDCPGLVMLCATFSQEKALRQAFKALQDAQEQAQVTKSKSKGKGSDAEILLREEELRAEVEELERQLQERREELNEATRRAHEVKQTFRSQDTPALKATRAQLNATRAKLMLKPV